MKKFALIFLIFTILATTSFAIDFIAAGETNLEAFKCLSIEQQAYVQNNEATALTLALAIDGTAAPFVMFSDLQLTLKPGETKAVTTFYNIPCDAEEGSYNLDIYVYTGEEQRIISQQIEVFTPDNLFIGINEAHKEVTPCGIADYAIEISNPLSFEEQYTFTIDAFPEEHSINETLTLQPYTKELIALKISPDDCKKYGDFSFNLIAKTNQTDLTKQIPLSLKINAYGILEISPSVDRIRTDYEEKEAGIIIKNLGDTDVTYLAEIEESSWITVQNEIQIAANSENELKLFLRPTVLTEEDEYTVKLILTRQNTHTKYEKELIVDLNPFSLVERKPAVIYVPLIIIILVVLLIAGILYFKKTKTYKHMKAKHEKRRAKYKALMNKRKTKLSKEKLKRLDTREKKRQKLLEKRQKRLEAFMRKKAEARKRKEEQRKLKAAKKAETRKRKEAKKAEKKKKDLEKIKAKEKAKKRLKQEITNKIKAEFKLIPKTIIKTVDQRKKSYFWIVYLIIVILLILILREIGLAILLLLVIILLVKESKKISYFSKQWQFLEKGKTEHAATKWKSGITAFNVLAMKNVEKAVLEVKRILPKIKDMKIYTGFVVKTNIDDILKLTNVKLRINKKWLKRRNIDVDDVRLVKNVRGDWKTQRSQFAGSDANYYYFKADSLTAGEYLIKGKPTPQEKKKKKKINILWIAVIGLIALFAIQPMLSFKGIPPQVWSKDTQHKIQLNDYFLDPDADNLIYSADEAENMLIEINGALAILTPQAGWTGETYTKFYAADPLGEEAISNPVRLIVKKNALFDRGLAWVNIVILALLLFLIILVLFEKKSKKNE